MIPEHSAASDAELLGNEVLDNQTHLTPFPRKTAVSSSSAKYFEVSALTSSISCRKRDGVRCSGHVSGAREKKNTTPNLGFEIWPQGEVGKRIYEVNMPS